MVVIEWALTDTPIFCTVYIVSFVSSLVTVVEEEEAKAAGSPKKSAEVKAVDSPEKPSTTDTEVICILLQVRGLLYHMIILWI